MTIKVERNEHGERVSYALHGRDLCVHELALLTSVDTHLAEPENAHKPLVFTTTTQGVMRKALRLYIDDCLDKLNELDADELKLENITLRAKALERTHEVDQLTEELSALRERVKDKPKTPAKRK